MLLRADQYHAHLYFDDARVGFATELHAQARADLGELATIWPMRLKPVGPHVAPMFEIEFPNASREPVLAWIHAHHGPLPVMLHPETGHVLEDHRDHAVWLGKNLGLKLEILEKLERSS
jgi:DOPA 4,5-dioxygenase